MLTKHDGDHFPNTTYRESPMLCETATYTSVETGRKGGRREGSGEGMDEVSIQSVKTTENTR